MLPPHEGNEKAACGEAPRAASTLLLACLNVYIRPRGKSS
jgi:hypothetical protein